MQKLDCRSTALCICKIAGVQVMHKCDTGNQDLCTSQTAGVQLYTKSQTAGVQQYAQVWHQESSYIHKTEGFQLYAQFF